MKRLFLSCLAFLFILNAFPQNNPPVANYEYYSLLELEPAELDILSNDTDPEGDEIKIYHASASNNCEVSINADSTRITVSPSFASSYQAYVSYTVIERNTAEAYISNPTKAYIKILPNNDIPVILPDTAYTTGGIPVTIPVLDNDYDRQGEAFEIFTNTYPGEGTLTQDGDDLIFTPYISREGPSEFTYRVRETYDPLIYSEYTRVRINVSKNPACPVGVPDQASGVTFQPMTIDVLSNDYDPNGETIEIYDIDAEGEATIEDNKIKYTSNPLEVGQTTLYYRIKQTNHPDYYSKWTPIYIELAPNPELPVAVDDYITGNILFPVTVSPMANDIENSADSLILIVSSHPAPKGKVVRLTDSLLSYQALTNAKDHDTIEYIISDKNNPEIQAAGNIIIDITESQYYDSLVINRINAGVNADGMLFANVGQIPGQGMYSDYNAHFKYPSDKTTSTIFNSLIWIGGRTSDDSLHFAGEYYRQSGADFQPGPVADAYDSIFAARFWKLWKLDKTEIEYHQSHCSEGGYQPIDNIATWPGNGDVAAGEASQLAPFFDQNQDGIYNPLDGDYPLIRGDQAIFFMMNDDKEHTSSFGSRLEVEIHGMVYGFNTPDDSALAHTVFVHYDLINRSDNTFTDTYIAIRTDFDIGYWSDDFVGSDINRASYFSYNGDDFDENYPMPYYENEGYGAYPPAQSVTVLAGPFLDNDGFDDPAGGCDFSINGINFGNGVNDDERYGLTGFFMKLNTGEQPDFIDSYNMMMSLWPDNTTLQYGGSGYPSSYDPRVVGPECRFMLPGDSDPLNFGTYCLPPNEPYNQDGYYWTDSTTNIPGDRNGLGSMGPFTFAPGDIQEIELAYVVANGWDGPVSSVNKLMEYIDSLRYRVSQGEIIVPNDHLGVNEIKSEKDLIRIFPNPASNNITINSEGTECSGSLFIIYDVFGRIDASGKLASNTNALDISFLKPGFYIITIKSDKSVHSGKFIKH